ncbi:type IV secretory system conjugative DNA transfer family protein [Cupriavidus nantongensis]
MLGARSRWADGAVVRAQGLLRSGDSSGVVIGAWKGRPMIDTSMKPVVVVGPARSGKGTSVLVPSLLTWRQSAVVLDVNGELGTITENWRRTEAHNQIRRVDFAGESSPDTYNFLDAIRRDTSHELADIEALAASLLPVGDKDGELVGHARALLTLCIIAKRPDGSAGLSDVFELLRRHDGPYATAFSYREVALGTELCQAAESLSYEFLKLPYDEAITALGMVAAALCPFAQPEIAKNTKRSSFKITELRGHGTPVTLYLTVKHWEIGLLQPLINAFLSQVARYTVQAEAQSRASRLLLLLDACGSLGHLDFMEEPLARLSERGVKPLIAVQNISANSTECLAWKQGEIRVVLPLNRPTTAEIIANEIRARVDHGSTETEPRPVTPEELLRMRRHDAVILGLAKSPIRAGLRGFYEDPKFRARTSMATAH